MTLLRYNHFINESEEIQYFGLSGPASRPYPVKQKYKMVYSKEFASVLSKVKSPVAQNLLSLRGKELDVLQNYIDVCRDKDDTITYVQNNRVKPEHFDRFMVTDTSAFIASEKLLSIFGLHRSGRLTPLPGTICKLHKIVSEAEIRKFMRMHPGDLFWFKSDNGGNYFQIKTTPEPRGIEKMEFPDIKGSEFKVGRFAKRALEVAQIEVSDKDVELFVNLYKAEIAKLNDIFGNFRLVEGEDIRKWYREESYRRGDGPLNGSCMRYDKCQRFMDIYVKNSDKIKMLILLDEYDPEKIIGRALVWKLDDGTTFMDRIYYIKDSTIHVFKDYAMSNEWKYKKDQNNSPKTAVMLGDNVSDDQRLKITLPELEYTYFPYVDTIKFMTRGNISKGEIKKDIVLTNYEGRYVLEHTDGRGGGGQCETCGGSQVINCRDCRGRGYFNCEDCDGEGEMICSNCDGSGRSTCRSCKGGKVTNSDGTISVCTICGGKGSGNCKKCGGDGVRPCSYCNQGRITCNTCDGNGERDCPDCV